MIDGRSVDDEFIPSVSASICSSPLSVKESDVKTSCDSAEFAVDESFAKNVAPKKQKNKVRSSVRNNLNVGLCPEGCLTQFAIFVYLIVTSSYLGAYKC